MGINNPLPSSLSSECKKCGKILTSFIDPRQAFGPEKVIPPEILANAKGLAILTVIKAGFLGSARFGSGLVVARLPDGSWSAPTAIMTAGGGFGGQIGFELTDFVFILNDRMAVKTFAQAGSITLGGNVSIAAGPVGRNAEAAGAASLKSVAGIFSYSKTKGLFAGVSLEGSAIIERKDANEKLYGQRLTAMQLLTGEVKPPSQAHPLMTVLNSRIFSGTRTGHMDDGMYNDIPVYGDEHNDANWNSATSPSHRNNDFAGPKRTSTWQDDEYDRPAAGLGRSNTGNFGDDYVYRDRPGSNAASTGFPPEKRAGPGRPSAPKPNLVNRQDTQNSLKKNQAVALFKFDAAQAGDLGFEKGAVIEVISTDGEWWKGRIGAKEGIFPFNYVKMKE